MVKPSRIRRQEKRFKRAFRKQFKPAVKQPVLKSAATRGFEEFLFAASKNQPLKKRIFEEERRQGETRNLLQDALKRKLDYLPGYRFELDIVGNELFELKKIARILRSPKKRREFFKMRVQKLIKGHMRFFDLDFRIIGFAPGSLEFARLMLGDFFLAHGLRPKKGIVKLETGRTRNIVAIWRQLSKWVEQYKIELPKKEKLFLRQQLIGVERLLGLFLRIDSLSFSEKIAMRRFAEEKTAERNRIRRSRRIKGRPRQN